MTAPRYEAHVYAYMLHLEACYWIRCCEWDQWKIDSRLVAIVKKRGKEQAAMLREAIWIAMASLTEERDARLREKGLSGEPDDLFAYVQTMGA